MKPVSFLRGGLIVPGRQRKGELPLADLCQSFEVNSMMEHRSPTATDGVQSQAIMATAFICANCAHPGQTQTSAGHSRPAVPNFDWPFPVLQVIVPCTGRLQPEHILKAFESGASVVCVVACAEDNCHYLEGSKRCARRVEYIRSILRDIGLGGARLQLFNLPGSAAEDMALSEGRPAPVHNSDVLDASILAIRDEVVHALLVQHQNPLRSFTIAKPSGDSYQQEVDASEDDSDE